MSNRWRGTPGIAVAVALAALAPVAAQAVVTARWGLNATADYPGAPRDASPRADQPTWTNDGTEVNLGNAGGSESWGIFYFDTSNLPPATVVRSARLRLSVYSHNEANLVWEPVYEISDPDGRGLWIEAEATFNSRRSGVTWTSLGSGNLATSVGGELDTAFLGNLPQWQSSWVEWEVTAAVRHWVADAATNSGLALPFTPGALYTVPASENADPARRPYLEITYEVANPARPSQVTGLAADHRSGQTFLTWNEIAGGNPETFYRVYRNDQPISAGNLDSANLLAEVQPDSGYYEHEDAGCSNGSGCSAIGQSRFIIADDGSPLAAGVGLFVHTAQDSSPVSAHYAVTAVVEGNENRDDFISNFAGPFSELRVATRPVRVWTNATGTGWVYTQFMDTQSWNPALEGYAYNFYVGVPANYASTGADFPLLAQLHAYTGTYRLPASPGAGGTDYEWPIIWLSPDDRTNTWWFGFGQNAGRLDLPLAGAPIVDYTQQRLDAILAFVTSELRVDENRMYLFGGSMGGSGAVNYGLRRGNLFAAIYAESAMTDFATAGDAGGTPWEDGSTTQLWGTVAENLPTTLGPSVWEWYDHQSWVAANPAAELPFLADHHGKADNVIDWETQGLPWTPPLEAGRHGFVGVFDNADHSWPGFVADSPMFTLTEFIFRRDESLLGFANSTNSDDPATTTGCRNCRLEWSASWNSFAGVPVDTVSAYEVVVRTSDAATATVDITPRRLQAFAPLPGALLSWQNQAVAGGVVQSGTAGVDGNGLWTVPGFAVSGTGNRLIVGIVAPSPLFADGFESGTLGAWSASVP